MRWQHFRHLQMHQKLFNFKYQNKRTDLGIGPFIFDEFILYNYIFKIYRGRRGDLTVGSCQVDVMKKSNHFIVTANYYGFII